MQPVSQRFLDAVTNGYGTVAVRMQVFAALNQDPILDTGITSASDKSSNDLRIVDGSVTLAKSSDLRTQFSVHVVDPSGDTIPTDSHSVFTPFGNVVRLWRGIDYGDGSDPEMVKLCTARISTVVVDDSSGALSTTISGYGLERIASRNVVETFWPDQSVNNYPLLDTFYTDWVRVAIQDRYPGAAFNDSAAAWQLLQNDLTVKTDAVVPVYYQEGEDLWKRSRDMADVVGIDLFANRDGVFTALRDPNYIIMDGGVPSLPVASFVEGSSAIFTGIKRTLTDEKTFNRIIVTGEGHNLAGPLKSAPADDTDPNSPTNIASSYGLVPRLETNSLLRTQQQADSYAQLLLRRSIGAQENVEFPTMVNPALDVDDVILVTRTRAGLTDVLYVIDTATIPLRAETPMQVKLRERRALA